MGTEVSERIATETAPLHGASPYELRINQGKHVGEPDIRSALKNGDMGFLHSFTTGSAVDGPGIRLVAWTTSCMFRCQYCHNPDTWTLANGIPVTMDQATDELRESVTVCRCRGLQHRLTRLVQHAHIKARATQIQTSVQH